MQYIIKYYTVINPSDSIIDKLLITSCGMYIPLCDYFGLTQQI